MSSFNAAEVFQFHLFILKTHAHTKKKFQNKLCNNDNKQYTEISVLF